ncbi:hypothetical protein PybrP1_007988 [[Pythium] brassicae (nom. inval.)]|nr:hypothetical protein PybrP1_007988 [[Pythium] brassicae (nom. inval.)]
MRSSARGYVSPSRVARTSASPRNELAPRPPNATGSSSSGATGGSVLPVLTPANYARAPSPNAFKRSVWTTPRSPGGTKGTEQGQLLDEIPRRFVVADDASDSSASTDSLPYPRLLPRRSSAELYERPKHLNDAAQHEQLAYMEHMYNTIQALNAALEKERQERAELVTASSFDDSDAAALEYPPFSSAGVPFDRKNVDEPDVRLVLEQPPPPGGSLARRLASPSRPQPPPKRLSAPPSQSTAAVLSRDQIELCATLGKNAELRIRTKEMERSAEKTTAQLEQAHKQMKLVERRVSNREEKLRMLLKEKLHWQRELKDMREHVVEEKMRQVELFRRLETAKREHAAQIEQAERDVLALHDENQGLRAQAADAAAHVAFQAKRLEDVARQAREEKEKLVACAAKTRCKFKEWKENEAAALRTAREQAVSNLKTEYELKLARHQEEKHKLREKVKDLEVSLRLMQKDRSLSPLELSLRKATILGSKDSAGTSEGELIEARARVRELEALLEHAQEFQTRQASILKVSEATISRLIQEREVAALENLSMQQLAGGLNAPDASAFGPTAASYLTSSLSFAEPREALKRHTYASARSPTNAHDGLVQAKPKAASSAAKMQPAASSPLLSARQAGDAPLEHARASASTFSLVVAAPPSKLSRLSVGDERFLGGLNEVAVAAKIVAARAVKVAIRRGLHHSLVLRHQQRKYVSKTFVLDTVRSAVVAVLNRLLDEGERAAAPIEPVKASGPKVKWALAPEEENAVTSVPKPSRRAERRRTSRRLFDASRFASIELMRDPTLAAYDAHHEQSQPFALLDANILTIDPHARHMQFDENDQAKCTDSEIRAKRKNLDHDNHRKSIAYRSIPAFNYAPMLIRFQWSDFVVATPIAICQPGTGSPGDKKAWNPASPVKSMRLLVKKGVKLPCGSYVIISAFVRPLEDGNENLRIHIYDAEWVEEFQYDFFEDHLKTYMSDWAGRDGDAKQFIAKLEFRREEGGIIIRLPDKAGRGEGQEGDDKRPVTAPSSISATPTDGKELVPVVSS